MGATLWVPLRPGAAALIAVLLAGVGLSAGALLLPRGHRALALAAALLIGCAAGTARAITPLPIEETSGVLTGIVAEQTDNGFVLRDAAFEGEPLGFRVAVGVWDQAPPRVGAQVRMTARIRTPLEQRNPGGYDDRASLWRQGIGLRATASGVTVEGDARRTLGEVALGTRYAVDSAIRAAMPGWEGGVLSALLLGVQDDMPEDLTLHFRNIGVAHILAVSGQHVAYLVMGLGLLMRFLGKKPAAAAAIVVVWAYSWLVGFMPSIVRASVMVTVAQAGVLFGRKPDGLTSLSLSALVILAFAPLQLFSSSFLLSFSAVGGMMLLDQPIAEALRRIRVPSAVASTLSASTAAQLGTLPVSAPVFHQIPLISLVANLPIIPLSGCVVMLGAVYAILSLLGVSALAVPLGWLTAGIIRLMAAIAGFLSEVPGTLLRVATPSAITLAASVALLIAFSPRVFLKRWRPAVCGALALMTALSFGADALARRPVGLEAAFMDVGQGDGLVLRTAGSTVVIDTGPPGTTMARYAQHMGLAIDAVFITHPHDDHAGGLRALIEAVPVRSVILPEAARGVPGEAAYAEAMLLVAELGIPVGYMRAGDAYALGGDGVIEAAWPEENAASGDENRDSLVLRVRYGGNAALVTGDIDAYVERRLATGPLALLKVAHHGSKYSSEEGFLAEARPALAVISSGRNTYGHPTQEVLSRLAAIDAQVLRTDQRGMVTVSLLPDGAMGYRCFLPKNTRDDVIEVKP